MTSFDKAFLILLEQEGGYVDDEHDEGGETRYGVSKARYPDLDIKNLTLDEAKEIYRRDYWAKYRCNEMPWPISLTLFDCVVNHSPLNPVRWLQNAVGANPDGQIGPRTMAAVKSHPDPIIAARDIIAQRVEYVKRLSDYPRFGKGWHRRHLAVLTEAARWSNNVREDL